jgi:hypothetical protein
MTTARSNDGKSRATSQAPLPGRRVVPTPAGERREPGARLPARWLAALLIADFVIRLVVAFKPIGFLDDLVFPDDTYYSLQIARAIRRGLGPLYGLDFTSGFQPLYVFLMAPVYALIPRDLETPIRVALVMLAVWDVAALWMLHRLVARTSRSRAAAVVAMVGWMLSPYVIQTSMNGLETVIAAFFLLAALDRLAALREAPAGAADARRSLGFGLLLGAGALARIDLLLLAPFAALEWLLAARRAGRGPGVVARGWLLIGAGTLLAYAPWLGYAFHYTGDLFPISGRAVHYMGILSARHHPGFATLYGPLLVKAGGVLFRKNVVLLALIAALLVGSPLLRARGGYRELAGKLRPVVPSIAFAAALVLAHVFVIFGYWHFPRYFFPAAVSLLLVFAALVGATTRALASGARRAFVLAVVIALAAGNLAHPSFARTFGRSFHGTWGYMRIGEWVERRFPPHTVVGGYQSGAIGYFADSLTVINLDGVVNRDCYLALRDRRYIEYIRGAGIRYLIWQDDIDVVRRESRSGTAEDVTLIEQVPGFTTGFTPWFVYRVNPARPPGSH